jgi:hypothetical protein
MAVARKKTTIYLDPELLEAVKLRAASTGRHDYEILEEALRNYLQAVRTEAGGRALRELMTELSEQSQLNEAEALSLAYSELDAARRERRG